MTEPKKIAPAGLAAGILLAITCAVCTPYAANAHHSVSAQYDFDWPFQFENAVFTRARWVNPHVYLFFEVENEQGQTEEWTIHTTGLTGLNKKGLGKEALVEGETYSIRGVRAHNGKPEGFLGEIVLLDGKSLVIWSGDPAGN